MNVLAYGGIVAVIGMLIVFFGLVILIACIWAMGKIFQALAKRSEKKAAEAAASVKEEIVPIEAAPVAEETAEEDPQLIAVIAAAIAAYDHSGKNLVVRKVRRVSGWNNSARSEQIYHF